MPAINQDSGGIPILPVNGGIRFPGFTRCFFYREWSSLRLMKLRDHAGMTYQKIPIWPPVWTERYGSGDVLVGEHGILKSCAVTDLTNQLYVFMTHRGKPYVARLLFDNSEFCAVIAMVLRENRGRTLREIGDLELPLGDFGASRH